jgi:hypothetical protein
MKNNTFVILLITGFLIFLLYRYTRKSGPQAKATQAPTKPPALVPDHAAPRPWIRNQVINPFAPEAAPIISTFEIETTQPGDIIKIAWGNPSYFPQFNSDEMDFSYFLATLGNITYSWGDGTSDTTPYINDNYGLSHQYPAPGTYKITVTGENVFISAIRNNPKNIILDNRVKILDIDNCMLDALPELPAALTSLICFNNNVTTLPATLPAALTYLDCNTNYLTALPANLPAGIKTLDCCTNSLTDLPATLPDALIALNCNINSLTTLPATLPAALIALNCNNNQLTALPATLPAALITLDCANNNLTALPATLPATLIIINCSFNNLTTLPATLPAALTQIFCSNNQITTLPATLPDTLYYLELDNNHLTTLPATLPAGLFNFNCNDNSFTTNDLNAAIEFFTNPENCPNIRSIALQMEPPAAPDPETLAAFHSARPNVTLTLDFIS